MDDLRFRDHEEFHAATLRMSLAGAGAGIFGHLALPEGSPIGLGLLALATAIAALSPAMRRDRLQIVTRMCLVALAVTALWAGPRWGDPVTAQGLFAVLLATAFALGLRGRRFLIAVAVGAAGVLLAKQTLGAISTSRELAAGPGWLIAAAGGAAFSFVAVLSIVTRHVELARDPIADWYRQLAPSVEGEMAEVVGRAHALWADAGSNLAEGDPNRAILAEGVQRVFEVAAKWSASKADDTRERTDSLVQRMEQLDGRIDATDDEIARAQYREAKDALAEQLRYLQNIGTSRERVLARMHNYLAAMERLRLAVVNLETANASRDADVEPLVANLSEIGQDIDTCAEALEAGA